MSNVKISVLLMTYNHSKFIKQAIESILMQKTNYSYEIVVNDDCSTDDTLKIIEHYKSLYPEKITILDNRQNLGITKNYKRGFKACTGEYIAVLEGDDYWVIPNKLQIQADFLDNHKNYAAVYNRYIMYDNPTGKWVLTFWNDNYKVLTFSTDDLIRANYIGNFSTCMYRNSIIKSLDDSLYEMEVYDWMFNIAVTQKGFFAYLPEVASVYRMYPSSSWNGKSIAERIKAMIKCCDEYNKFLNYKYNDYFEKGKQNYIRQLKNLSE